MVSFVYGGCEYPLTPLTFLKNCKHWFSVDKDMTSKVYSCLNGMSDCEGLFTRTVLGIA